VQSADAVNSHVKRLIVDDLKNECTWHWSDDCDDCWDDNYCCCWSDKSCSHCSNVITEADWQEFDCWSHCILNDADCSCISRQTDCWVDDKDTRCLLLNFKDSCKESSNGISLHRKVDYDESCSHCDDVDDDQDTESDNHKHEREADSSLEKWAMIFSIC